MVAILSNFGRVLVAQFHGASLHLPINWIPAARNGWATRLTEHVEPFRGRRFGLHHVE